MQERSEEAIEEFLDGKPRAQELADMVEALEVRRSTFQRELDGTDDPAKRKQWISRLTEVDGQIRVLREELAITGFVENSVRASVNRAGLDIEE